MLYPIENETRELKCLDGLWQFSFDHSSIGEKEEWYSKKIPKSIDMAVPSSINELLIDPEEESYIGDMWYQKEVFISKDWELEQVHLRIGAAAYHSKVWINNNDVFEHHSGFLPLDCNISNFIKPGRWNTITIKLNNELSWQTLPPGTISETDNKKHLKTQHDFYHYTGLHRSVYLYTTPNTFIEEVSLNTDLDEGKGWIDLTLSPSGVKTADSVKWEIQLKDKEGKVVLERKFPENSVQFHLDNPRLWSPADPYLYELEVWLSSSDSRDKYSLPVGIRSIEIKSGELYLNGEKMYLKGFGKHEDMDIKGKAFDDALALKDFALMKWSGANSFRTSHYPYAEEWLQMADREGFLIIDEIGAVGMLGQSVPAIGELDGVFQEDKINDLSQKNHMKEMEMLIRRDRNHPSVVMWCVANEASTMEEKAGAYFEPIINKVRELDSRPVMNVNLMLIEPEKCQVSKMVDVIGLNAYFGWYSSAGDLNIGKKELIEWLDRWKKAFDKPLMITEFGVDTVQGLHKLPATMFSEEFQADFLKMYTEVFDTRREIIGEHVWNFADFMTGQGIVRVDGNKKGIFTRQRQPKMAAYKLKDRWRERED
ncbi:beta-glucuronidase [Alkalicoccus halolimnae]|uniref:Beta-glucuronidase n=1 Tax=Alkalicoccus halolimnae TaxID=1667239 RepID=A0A5C7F495_9BACI|nr:beta-glucuronidase [Alkalicoccus halolimnae]TXF85481.1 beta-glucuronidase [Alkalicoccus halolimnae]